MRPVPALLMLEICLLGHFSFPVRTGETEPDRSTRWAGHLHL